LKGDGEDDEDGGNYEIHHRHKIVAAAKVAHLLCVCSKIFLLVLSR
jgi:hypothetical protein